MTGSEKGSGPGYVSWQGFDEADAPERKRAQNKQLGKSACSKKPVIRRNVKYFCLYQRLPFREAVKYKLVRAGSVANGQRKGESLFSGSIPEFVSGFIRGSTSPGQTAMFLRSLLEST